MESNFDFLRDTTLCNSSELLFEAEKELFRKPENSMIQIGNFCESIVDQILFMENDVYFYKTADNDKSFPTVYEKENHLAEKNYISNSLYTVLTKIRKDRNKCAHKKSCSNKIVNSEKIIDYLNDTYDFTSFYFQKYESNKNLVIPLFNKDKYQKTDYFELPLLTKEKDINDLFKKSILENDLQKIRFYSIYSDKADIKIKMLVDFICKPELLLKDMGYTPESLSHCINSIFIDEKEKNLVCNLVTKRLCRTINISAKKVLNLKEIIND